MLFSVPMSKSQSKAGTVWVDEQTHRLLNEVKRWKGIPKARFIADSVRAQFEKLQKGVA